jgi:molybdenum cofactor biosynthesis enzyme MoaA
MQHNTPAPLKLRFLLTSACTARCGYCHNEGQTKDNTQLSLQAITRVLDTLAAGNRQISEIVLSGGEPTLHPQLAEIARRSQASGALVSINTHGAHPGLLERALPWIDELKLHIDSFNPQRQKHSMGLSIDKVLQSIERSRQHPGLRTVVNHPLQSLTEASEVLATTRSLGVECKFIELLDAAHACPQLSDIPWAALGYQATAPGLWQHRTCGHRAMARRCNTHQTHATELFIGADGVRTQLQGEHLGAAHMFTLDMLAPQPQPRLQAHAGKRPTEQTVRFFPRPNRLAATA